MYPYEYFISTQLTMKQVNKYFLTALSYEWACSRLLFSPDRRSRAALILSGRYYKPEQCSNCFSICKKKIYIFFNLNHCFYFMLQFMIILCWLIHWLFSISRLVVWYVVVRKSLSVFTEDDDVLRCLVLSPTHRYSVYIHWGVKKQEIFTLEGPSIWK